MRRWCLAGAAGGEKLALALARVEALARDEDGASWTPPGAGEAGSRKAPGKGLGPHIAGEVTLATCPRPTVSCPLCLGKAGSSPAEVGLPGASCAALWCCARPWSGAGVCQVPVVSSRFRGAGTAGCGWKPLSGTRAAGAVLRKLLGEKKPPPARTAGSEPAALLPTRNWVAAVAASGGE